MQTDNERSFWSERWTINQTNWDQGGAHASLPLLIAHARREGGLADGAAIFSSGCGRAHNEAAMARWGYVLTARDIVPKAIEEARALYGSVQNLSLDVADVFQVSAPGQFAAVFDRAMLCALQPKDRADYLAKVASILQPGGLFMGLLFRKVNREIGPPFGIDEKTAWDLFQKDFTLCFVKPIPIHDEKGTIEEEYIGIWRKRSGETTDEV